MHVRIWTVHWYCATESLWYLTHSCSECSGFYILALFCCRVLFTLASSPEISRCLHLHAALILPWISQTTCLLQCFPALHLTSQLDPPLVPPVCTQVISTQCFHVAAFHAIIIKLIFLSSVFIEISENKLNALTLSRSQTDVLLYFCFFYRSIPAIVKGVVKAGCCKINPEPLIYP